MRRRVVGLSLLGFGAFLLAAALAVRVFLVPTMVRLLLDQGVDPETVVTVSDENGTYLDMEALEERQGPVTATLKVQGDPAFPDASDDVAVWHSGTTVTDEDGTLLTDPAESEIVNCLDRRTAEAVSCDAASAAIEGLTVTFPFDTQQRDYDVWNNNVGQAVPARYAGEDEVDGVAVYRFEQSVPETVIRQIEVPGDLAGSPGEPSVTADVVYSSERVILVEPTSGKIVSSVEHPVTVLRGPDGQTGVTVLEATLGPDGAGLAKAAEEAAATRDEIRMISTVVPWSVAGVGLVLVVVGVVLIVSSRPQAGRRPQSVGAPPVAVPAAS